MPTYSGTFTWNSQPPPAGAPGEFRSDSRNWSGAAVLSMSGTDMEGDQASRLWAVMQTGDTIHCVQANNTTNSVDWTLTAAPTQQGDGTWQIAVSRTGSTGQASNNQPCTFTIVAAASGVQADQRICDEYDLDGFKLHKMLLPVQLSASTIGPQVGWCQWCHELVVTAEPTQSAFNIG